MTAKEANFTIKFNGDTGALVQDLQKLKGVVDKLDLSSTMKANFTKVFSDLERSLGKVGDGFANGLKDNRSIAVFEQNLEQSGRLLDKLKQGLLSIPEDVIKKAFTADPQELKDITDQVDTLNKKINDEALVAFGNLEKKLEALGKETKAHALGDFINHLKSGDIENAARDFKKLQTYFSRVTEGTNKYAVWQQAIDAIGKEFEKLLPSVTATEAEIGKLEARAENLNETAGTEGKQSIDNIAQGLDDVKDSSQQAGQSFVETSKDANSLQKELDGFKNKVSYFFGLNNAVRLFQRALRSAFETVKDLDKVMTETAVVTDFSVGDMWTQLPEYTQRANELGVSIHDVYEASTLYYQQGLKTNEVMAVTNATLKMARIAGLEASEATDRMTNALRGFNMEITEANANNIADVYSKLAAITASNVDEISTAMTKTASLAASANMSFENTAAFLAQIIETTRESAETAGTALKTVIARFSEVKKLYSEGELLGTDAEGEAIDINKVSTALRTAGIDMNEFLTGAKGLDEVFIELASKWNSLTLVQQRYIATMAAGSRQQSRFIALMSDYQRTMQLTGAANNAAGASTKQYEKTLESFQTKIERLKNAYNEFVLGIANSSVIKFGIDLLTGILTKLNELTKGATEASTSFKKLMLSIGLFSGAKAVLKGFEKNILGSIAQAFGKEGQNSGKSFIEGLGESFQKAKGIFKKDSWISGIAASPEQINSLKLLKAALDGNIDAMRSLDVHQEALQALQNKGLTLDELSILATNTDTLTRFENADSIDDQTAAELKKTAADLMEQNSVKKGIILKLAEKAQRITNAWGVKAETNALYAFILAKIKENEVLTENVALQMASLWYLTAIAAIIAVIAATIASVIVIAKRGSTAFKLDKLNQSLDNINDALSETQTKLDTLTSASEDLDELNNGFEGLTKGTTQWTEQLVKANQKVIDLVGENKELGQFITLGEHGQLTITAEGLENLVQTQTDKIIALQREALDKTNEITLVETRANINSIMSAAGFGKAGTEWGFGGARQQRAERRQYGGLTFNEFYRVAARLQQQGVSGAKGSGDVDAINGAEAAIIRQTLAEFNLEHATDSFIDKLNELGIVFDQVAGEAQKLQATQLSSVLGKAVGNSDIENEIISMYQENILAEFNKIGTSDISIDGKIHMGNIDKETLQKMGFQIDTELGGDVVKWIDASGKEVQDTYIEFARLSLEQLPEIYQAAYKSIETDKILDKYKSVVDYLSPSEQKILTSDLSLTRTDVNQRPNISGTTFRELRSMGIDPQPIIQQFQSQKQKISSVFSNISNWLPNNIVDKLTYGTAQVITEGLNQVPVAFRQKYLDRITSFLDSANLNDTQYNVAMQHLMSGNFDAFKEYLIKIGKDIPSSKLSEFQGILSNFNSAFQLTNLSSLITRFKELDGVMGKIAEGTREYSDEEKAKLIESGGANEEDFIKIGDDVYYFKGNLDEVGETMAQKPLEDLVAYRAGMETPGIYYDAQAAALGLTTLNTQAERDRIDAETRDAYSSAGARGIRVSGSEEDMAAWDEGLRVLIEKDYPQLIGLVEKLGNTRNRVAALLAIKNEQARESYKNLTSAIQDNIDILDKQYKGTDEYAAAIQSITQYAKEAFGSNISEDFVDKNLDAFVDFANGAEDSLEQIRRAILMTTDYVTYDADALMAYVDQLDNLNFDVNGQADFTQIYKALMEIFEDSKLVDRFLQNMSYTWEVGDDGTAKIIKTGKDVVGSNFRSYGGGASKSSGGGGKDPVLTAYDELYNLVQQINTTLREREKLEKDYERMVEREGQSVEAIKQKHLDILAALQKERDQESQLLAGRRQQAASILNEQYLDNGVFKTYGQMGMSKYGSINTTTGEITLDIGLINSITDADEKARVDAYIQRLEYYGDEIKSGLDSLEDINDKIYEEQQRGKQDYLELEERTYQALVNQQQKVIDGYKDLSDAITDANQQIISSLRESVEMERQIRDNTRKEEDIADKEARLAYLRRDTSGANDTEIMKLEKELGEAREQYADSLVDQAIADLEDQNEKASEQRQKQIDLMQKQLDYAAESGAFWDQTYQLIADAVNPDGTFNMKSDLAEFLKNDANFAGMSVFGQQNWMQSMLSQYASAMTGLENWKAVDLVPTGDAGTKLGDLVTTTQRIASQTGAKETGTPSPDVPVDATGRPRYQGKWTGPTGSKDKDESETPVKKTETFTGPTYSEIQSIQAAVRSLSSVKEKELAKLLGIDIDDLDIYDSNIIKAIWQLIKDGKFYISDKYKFASGGLVTSTGPAWLDGSLSSPEMVLNAKDTANLIQLKSILAQILSGGTIPGGSGDNYYNIDINVDELGSDYDVDKIAARIKQKIYDDSIYRNVNAINYIR